MVAFSLCGELEVVSFIFLSLADGFTPWACGDA